MLSGEMKNQPKKKEVKECLITEAYREQEDTTTSMTNGPNCLFEHCHSSPSLSGSYCSLYYQPNNAIVYKTRVVAISR